MNRMNRVIVNLAAAALLALSAGSSWTAEQPDATLDYKGGSVAIVVGYRGGTGVLHYKGMDYRFTANGLSIGDVGASGGEGTGDVFHLNRIEDFPGHYAAFTAGASIVVGAGGATMRNQNGVIIHVGAVNAGLQVTLAPAGVAVTLEGPPTPSLGSASK